MFCGATWKEKNWKKEDLITVVLNFKFALLSCLSLVQFSSIQLKTRATQNVSIQLIKLSIFGLKGTKWTVTKWTESNERIFTLPFAFSSKFYSLSRKEGRRNFQVVKLLSSNQLNEKDKLRERLTSTSDLSFEQPWRGWRVAQHFEYLIIILSL